MKHILILDDDKTTCLMLKSWFAKKGFNVHTATKVEDAQTIVKTHALDLILSDIRMPDVDGFSFLSWIKRYDSAIMVIMMTGFSDVKTAVESMKSGAVDYIEKPIKPEVLFEKVENAFTNYANNQPARDPSIYFSQPRTKAYEVLMQKVEDTIENQKHILIIGERGTGKSSLRKYIHEKNDTPHGAVVVIDEIKNNDPNFFEAHLDASKKGIFCIKSFHKLSKKHQNQLIDFLYNQSKSKYTQVIATSSASINELRVYLLPKLFQIFHNNYVVLPTLDGKKEEIVFFMQRFLKYANHELGKAVEDFSPKMQKILINHSWKGNIQELKNTVIKSVLLTEGDTITTDILPDLGWNFLAKDKEYKPSPKFLKSLKKENYEQQKIEEAMELANGNKTLAASILNIDRKTLYNKIRQYGVEVN